MTTAQTTWFRRHPWLSLLVFNAVVFGVLLGFAEIFLRIWLPYNPGYYMAVGGTSTDVEYAFGTIKINSEGFADAEFDLSKPRRVAYVGDSVTFGIGAGYGHRFTELLEQAYPEFEHMNLGGIGLTLSENEIGHVLRLAERYEFESAIYFFNLNDIVPDQIATDDNRSATAKTRFALMRYVDWLRGKSFVYTYLRTKIKTALEVAGVGYHGYDAFELFPIRNRDVLDQTARRINLLESRLAERGIELAVVILPYEMQISNEAAEAYKSLGVKWEDGFLDASAQAIIREQLDAGIEVFDAYHAFVDQKGRINSRSSNALGEFFVYNKGDRLDWNHPNRAGHRAIANYLVDQRILGDPNPPN